MNKVLEGKVAIITGSGMGIGRAVALDMARQGASVVTNNRMARPSGGDAETTAAEITASGGAAAAFFGDVSNYETARAIVETAVQRFGKVDILVNNAGGEDKRAVPWQMPLEDWERTIRTHLTGAFNCIRHASGLMKDQKWGRILNTTSRAWIETTESPNYAAAMGGIIGLTRTVARDIGKYGVTCNAYSPFAKTRRTNVEKHERAYAAGQISRQMYEMYLNIPQPEGCAAFVTYLCSEDAADINGSVFGIKAGEISIFAEPVEEHVIRKKTGLWTHDELVAQVPKVLLKDYVNPAPRKN